jgi:hypothetical protein
MPYIEDQLRKQLDSNIEGLQKTLRELGNTEGDLNYSITRLVARAFLNDPRYYSIARVSGVLDNVYSEFYERIGIPYERGAREKNGDIPEYIKFEQLAEAKRRETVAEVVTAQE